MNKEWTSYWYICTNCDTSIEMTTRRTVNKAPNCTCKNSSVVLCNEYPAITKVVA